MSSTTASPVLVLGSVDASDETEILIFTFQSLGSHICTGATVVDWLIAKGKARNRPEALMLATGLMTEGFLQPAGDLSKDGAEAGEQAAFMDHTKALYYFVSSRDERKKSIFNQLIKSNLNNSKSFFQ